MLRSLVGSEMCIRDRSYHSYSTTAHCDPDSCVKVRGSPHLPLITHNHTHITHTHIKFAACTKETVLHIKVLHTLLDLQPSHYFSQLYQHRQSNNLSLCRED
eukprot:TRINITY_DN20738_c0_g1_i2.p1 TRINITY_DN20738_c0_g1~~TRINITY_DN20738_c0_g1_i2.p1  ORF type:complete len:102 (+),score=6.52 TRINITY_DN20738_c0_g1_i2:75-380(+)